MSVTDDEVVRHLDRVGVALRGLGARNAFAFGAACVERMFPALQEALIGSGNEATVAELRDALDEVWDWAARRVSSPPARLAACGQKMASGEACGLASAMVHYQGNALLDLAGALLEGDGMYCRYTAARPLDLIDMAGDEERLQPGQADRLLLAEMRRQEADLARLAQGEGHDGIRRDAVAASLFEGQRVLS